MTSRWIVTIGTALLSVVGSGFFGYFLYEEWTLLYFVWLATLLFAAVPWAFSSKKHVAIAGSLGLVAGTLLGPFLYSAAMARPDPRAAFIEMRIAWRDTTT